MKGWLLNNDNVYVGRWTRKIPKGYNCKWGNPHRLRDGYSRREAVQLYRKHVLSNKQLTDTLGELTGKVLGCWCSPYVCHAEELHHLAGNHPVHQTTPSISKMSGTENEAVDLSVDQKLDIILKRTCNIDETLAVIGGRLDKIEKDTKALSHKLIVEIDDRVALAAEVQETKSKVSGIEDSCSFLNDKYDAILLADQERKKLATDIAMLEKENTILKQRMDNLTQNLQDATVARNIEQQYHRTSLNIKLCGIPLQTGEDESKEGPSNPITREIIDIVCKTAQITMKNNAIDVCHRLGRKPYSPIIIRFSTKYARFDFFNQGMKKLKGFTSASFDFTKMKKRGVVPAATPAVTRSNAAANVAESSLSADAPHEASPVYLQEHLTSYNKTLLKETRAALQATHQFYGYVKNGEIRVKLNEQEKYAVITCTADYQRELVLARNRDKNPTGP